MLKKLKTVDYRIFFFRLRYIILSLLIAFTLTIVVSAVSDIGMNKTAVFAVKTKIESGAKISADSVREVKIDKSLKPADAFETLEEIISVTAKVDIEANAILTASMCYRNLSDLLPENKVITSVGVINSVDSDIFSPGSYINLLTKSGDASKRIAEKALILENKNTGNKNFVSDNNLIIGLDAEEAEHIARLENKQPIYAILTNR